MDVASTRVGDDAVAMEDKGGDSYQSISLLVANLPIYFSKY